MISSNDIRFMKRAIRLAWQGAGLVNPNPMVGAVIVRDGQVIAEGAHTSYGGPHAEIVAMNKAAGHLRNATLYVTLEPCNHQGKTPPCTERILREGISRVVAGMPDPNPAVEGGGMERLRKAGIQTDLISGPVADAIKKQNEVYLKYVTSGLPYCAMKSAMTLDGKISTYSGDSKWISNEKSRSFAHELRHRYHAIMVGVNTVIKDNPLLTDRSDHTVKKNPVRIIADSTGRTPLKAHVMNSNQAPTILAVTERVEKDFVSQAEEKGVSVIRCPETEGRVNLQFLTRQLGAMGIDSILLEGGSTLNFSALQEGIVDKVYAFISPKLVGGALAMTPMGGSGFDKIADAITLNIGSVKRFEDDLMIEAYVLKK